MTEPGYRRSTGTPRGQARRAAILEQVTRDLAENGLPGFSLRRAARAAGTTHKVLLYHFEGHDELLLEAIQLLRIQRIDRGLSVATLEPGASLAQRVRAIWPILTSGEGEVLNQAIGLSMYDPVRYADLGRGSTQQYLPALVAICPPAWTDTRKIEVSEMILAVLRGLIIDRVTSGDEARVEHAFAALDRALDREEFTQSST
ncbi:MAG: TetR family transcriptional regulator [Actinomycetia bacterium]|nr:TetR family transcriptional regulator [Actinomycetes bacterium]